MSRLKNQAQTEALTISTEFNLKVAKVRTKQDDFQ